VIAVDLARIFQVASGTFDGHELAARVSGREQVDKIELLLPL
jgi:translation initiation factor IF-1